MRTLLILVALVVVMALIGWITFGHEPGRSSINIETDEIRRDTEDAIEHTGDAIEEGTREISGALNDSDVDVEDDQRVNENATIEDDDVDVAPTNDDDVELEEAPR